MWASLWKIKPHGRPSFSQRFSAGKSERDDSSTGGTTDPTMGYAQRLTNSSSRLSGAPRRTLLVYPDDRRLFELRVLLLEFAGSGAERNAFWLREIRRRPFPMAGGVTRGGEDILFLRHGRIRCMCRMIRKLVDLRFTADIGHTTILGKCRACEK